MVLSVSKTFLKLKDLILEKNTLQEQVRPLFLQVIHMTPIFPGGEDENDQRAPLFPSQHSRGEALWHHRRAEQHMVRKIKKTNIVDIEQKRVLWKKEKYSVYKVNKE